MGCGREAGAAALYRGGHLSIGAPLGSKWGPVPTHQGIPLWDLGRWGLDTRCRGQGGRESFPWEGDPGCWVPAPPLGHQDTQERAVVSTCSPQGSILHMPPLWDRPLSRCPGQESSCRARSQQEALPGGHMSKLDTVPRLTSQDRGTACEQPPAQPRERVRPALPLASLGSSPCPDTHSAARQH